tara:strand:+ start:2770 stop:3951 length:1182 start_codon:yes stop_codon:yes gene_type:complete
MATTLGGGFNFTAPELVDSRFIITASNERFTFEQARTAIGLTTYASESRQYFILTDSSSYTSNAGWSTIPISDLNNTSSFTFVNLSASVMSASQVSASDFDGGTGSFYAVNLGQGWGDLSASLALIKASVGAQDLASVTALGSTTTLGITASRYVASASNNPSYALRNNVVFPENGARGGVLIWEKEQTQYGHFAEIELRYTSKVGKPGGGSDFTGSAALIFSVSPLGVTNRQVGDPNPSMTNIPVLILSGTVDEGQAIFPSLTTGSPGAGQDTDAKVATHGVVISGGSGSISGSISPFSQSTAMKFGNSGSGYTLDFNNNIAQFGDTFISGADGSGGTLKFHSAIHEFKGPNSVNQVKVDGKIVLDAVTTAEPPSAGAIMFSQSAFYLGIPI